MSSYPTGPISTTGSSTSWPSPTELDTRPRTAVIACGALAGPIREIVARRAWRLEVHLLPALLHNRPERIAPRVERLARELQELGQNVVVAYADCGTYGALDDVCTRLRLGRLAGQHCYDVFAGVDRLAGLFAEEPGTYLLTDFLVRTFSRTVLAELGLDRRPELWPDYFAHYRRLVWLAQRFTPELEAEARAIAERFVLPLEVLVVGTGSLEDELEVLLERAEVLRPTSRHAGVARA